MSKKVLLVANTDMHVNLCYLPYMKYFKEQGYVVHVVTNTDECFENCDKKIKIPIKRSPFRLSNIKATKILKKIIDEENYDLITTSTPMGSVTSRLAVLFSKNKNAKLLYTAHGFHFYKGCPIFNWLVYYPVEKILMKVVDILVTINKEDYDFAKKHFNVDVRYIKGIGFQSHQFESKLKVKDSLKLKKQLMIDKNDYVIIYIAELSKRKRQEYLIECLSQMDLSNIKVLLPGNNIIGNKISKLITKYNLEDKVKILGFCDNISDLLDISDLVVSVSKQEGLPLNIMEAMKKEKPIIVTDCRGNRDLIKNKVNGLVVPLNDKLEFIKKVYYLKNNSDYARKIGLKNRSIIDQYSVDVILPQYVKIYNELLGVDYEKNME